MTPTTTSPLRGRTWRRPLWTLAAWGGIAAVAAAGAEVHLKRSAAVTGRIVRLGDVADIEAASDELRARLAAVELGPAPPAGAGRAWQIGAIEDALAHRGVPRRDVRLAGASEVRVERAAEIVVPKAGVQAAARAQVAAVRDASRHEPPPPLIRRGDVVTVRAYAAGVRVKTTARARQPGAMGAVIEVESLVDKKPYFARVCGVQEAAVHLGTSPPSAEP